ncbi:MAG: hypothetical protein ACR2NP_08595, partial [Pirellulaceae bacterium]
LNREPKPIGGFFELEIPPVHEPVHDNAIALSTGRSCLLAALEYQRPRSCYVPHYTCDATLLPFWQLGIETPFYELDSQLRPVKTPELAEDECFLITNYWGLQRELASTYSEQFGSRLIVDDTHDYYSFGHYPKSWSFTSARKYFGVPDGAFLYIPAGVEHDQVVGDNVNSFQSISLEHSVNRLLGRQEQAFVQYQAYEKSLPCALDRISDYSWAILSSLDLTATSARRRANFDWLAEQLGTINALEIDSSGELTPFVYPLLPRTPMGKKSFHEQRIFVPTLWPDVLQRPNVTCKAAIEYTQNLIPLPVDHRYGEEDMQRIVDVTLSVEGQSK